jgi:hypothetical protein
VRKNAAEDDPRPRERKKGAPAQTGALRDEVNTRSKTLVDRPKRDIGLAFSFASERWLNDDLLA